MFATSTLVPYSLVFNVFIYPNSHGFTNFVQSLNSFPGIP